MKANSTSIRNVSWEETGDPVYPYAARVGGEEWKIRMNDFPDEHLYTLLKDGIEAESFDDWPVQWDRTQQSNRVTTSQEAEPHSI